MPFMSSLELGKDSECFLRNRGVSGLYPKEMGSPDLERGLHQGFLSFPAQ